VSDGGALIRATRIIGGHVGSSFNGSFPARAANRTAQKLWLLVGWNSGRARLTAAHWRICDWRIYDRHGSNWHRTFYRLMAFNTFWTIKAFWTLRALWPLKTLRALIAIVAELTCRLFVATVWATVWAAIGTTFEPLWAVLRPKRLVATIVGTAVATRVLAPSILVPEIRPVILEAALLIATFRSVLAVLLVLMTLTVVVAIVAHVVIANRRTVIKARRIKAAWLGLISAHHRLTVATVALEIVVLVVGEFAIDRRIACLPLAHHAAAANAARFALLFAVGENNAVVVFGVLEIVLSQNRIARCLRIACQCDILFRHVGRCAAYFYVGTVALKTARERVLALTVVVIAIVVAVALMMATAAAVIVTATASAVLLSLPHGLHSRSLNYF
jgi:hypothetical protein